MRFFSFLVFIIIFPTLNFSCSKKISNNSDDYSKISLAYSNSGHTRGIHNYKYETALKVFNDLVEARGTAIPGPPDFILSPLEENAAWTDENGLIGLEEKAYDVCTSFGKDSLDALAVLLAHELTHYYEGHFSKSHILLSYVTKNKSKKVKNKEIELIFSEYYENIADKLGGFLANRAGYSGIGMMRKILNKIYKEYGYEEKLQGYPSLQERCALADSSAKEALKLATAFDMANNLMSIGNYDQANKYFKYILKNFQSREIYNNAGVCLVLIGMNKVSLENFRYIYPIELDGISRLNKTVSRGGSNLTQKEKKLLYPYLDTALQYFVFAKQLDKRYHIATLNKANVYVLKDNYKEAEKLLDADFFYKVKDSSIVANAYTLLGIINSYEDNEINTLKYFDMAIGLGSQIAKINKDIIKGKPLFNSWNIIYPSINEKPLKDEIDKIKKTERIDNIDFIIPFGSHDTYTLFTWRDTNDNRFYLDYNNSQPYTIIKYFNTTQNKKTKQGIKIGDPVQKVYARYGKPHNILSFLKNEIIVYKNNENKNGIIFRIKNEKVTSWGIFIF